MRKIINRLRDLFICRYVLRGGQVFNDGRPSLYFYQKIPPIIKGYVYLEKRKWGSCSRSYVLFIIRKHMNYDELIYFTGIIWRDNMLFYDCERKKWRSKLFYITSKTEPNKYGPVTFVYEDSREHTVYTRTKIN